MSYLSMCMFAGAFYFCKLDRVNKFKHKKQSETRRVLRGALNQMRWSLQQEGRSFGQRCQEITKSTTYQLKKKLNLVYTKLSVHDCSLYSPCLLFHYTL